jgi:hypothetical protein
MSRLITTSARWSARPEADSNDSHSRRLRFALDGATMRRAVTKRTKLTKLTKTGEISAARPQSDEKTLGVFFVCFVSFVCFVPPAVGRGPDVVVSPFDVAQRHPEPVEGSSPRRKCGRRPRSVGGAVTSEHRPDEPLDQ